MHRKVNPLKGGGGADGVRAEKKRSHARRVYSSRFFSLSLRKSRSAAKFRDDFGPTRADSLNFPYRHGCGEVDIAPAILHSEISGTKGIMTIRSPGITSECYLERDRSERERIGVLFSIRKSQQEFAQPVWKGCAGGGRGNGVGKGRGGGKRGIEIESRCTLLIDTPLVSGI